MPVMAWGVLFIVVIMFRIVIALGIVVKILF